MVENLEGEIWKDVVGYEGLYQVSNKGRVKSNNYHKTGEEQLLAITFTNYYRCSLYKNKQHCQLVHRLVAEAFLPNPNHYPCVNHKDENPHNNCIENLEWCTAQYNCNYGSHNDNLSKALKGTKSGERNPMYGKKHKLDSKVKISEARKGKYAGENHPFYGKRGVLNPNFGKHRSEESIKRLSESHIGEKNHAFGKHWFNNGVINIQSKECPEGFIKGRLPFKRNIKHDETVEAN